MPEKYSLEQNYPNPFNPTTNIRYQIKNSSPKRVSLKIIDAIGREVETLINEKQSIGTFETLWDASKYPSGVYFYKLITEDYSETKRMILLK